MFLTLRRTPGFRSAENIYWLVALAMAAAAGLVLVFMILDERTLNSGPGVWSKPLKFTLSLAIHAATLAWVTSRLSPAFRSNRALSVVALAFLCASLLEIAYIVYQAALGEPSHFNMSTAFNSIMWSAMAVAAVIVIAPAAIVGVSVMLDGSYSSEPVARWAIVVGLTVGTLLTIVTAFSIGANMSSYVGAKPMGDSERMMLTGWSLVGGDLRVPHFLSTHMIQIIPVFGVIIGRLTNTRSGLILVSCTSVLFVAFTLFQYAEALSGTPSLLALRFS